MLSLISIAVVGSLLLVGVVALLVQFNMTSAGYGQGRVNSELFSKNERYRFNSNTNTEFVTSKIDDVLN